MITGTKGVYQVKSYLDLPHDYDDELAYKWNNGCGPAGWKGKAVPETNYGIRISDACHVHVFDFGKEDERGYFSLPEDMHPIVIKYIDEKWPSFARHGAFAPLEIYNFRFWSNILKIIDKESKWWNEFLNPLRRRRAKTYYWFVQEQGENYNK